VETSRLSSKRTILIAAAVIGLLAVGWLIAYEPVTRNLISRDAICSYCHLEQEYFPTARLSATLAHPAEPKADQKAAVCIDCHLPKGWWNATYAYTHFLSATDLFGHFRDRDFERSGKWIPPRAATAYRVRDRLFEYDSATCRSCHIEAEIKPKRKRGQNAHKKALENKDTCIECHNNLVHRMVDLRKTAFKKPAKAAKAQ